MTEYIKEFLLDKSAYCAKDTVIYYRDNLRHFYDWCFQNNYKDLHDLNYNVLRNFILYLRAGNLKNVSVNTYFRPVKTFAKWLYSKGYLTEDITSGVQLPRSDAALVFPLSSEEVKICDSVFVNQKENALRNYCTFHLMLDCGLRRNEVINLQWSDISKEIITIKNSKFNKSRIVLCPDFLYRSLLNYMSFHPQDEYIFMDRYYRERITKNTIKQLFFSLKQQAGIERIHAHLCRHTFATSYLYYGGNMEMLRLLMGHANYDILQNYLHLATLQKLQGSELYKLDDIYFRRF